MGEMLTPYERLLSFCEGKQEAEEQLGVSIDAAFLKAAAGSQCHECPGVLSYPGDVGPLAVGFMHFYRIVMCYIENLMAAAKGMGLFPGSGAQ